MKKSSIVYIVLTVLVICTAVGIAAYSIYINPGAFVRPNQNLPESVLINETPKPFPLAFEEIITSETIRDSFQDVERLVTEEYYFTEVMDYSTMKDWWIIAGLTKSNLLCSYDGTITAGVDLSETEIEIDNEKKNITAILPAAEILSINIDHSSLKVYQEKEGFWNKFTADNYNDALQRLEETIEQKAIDRGILTRAEENASKIMKQFIISVIGTTKYTVEIVRK